MDDRDDHRHDDGDQAVSEMGGE